MTFPTSFFNFPQQISWISSLTYYTVGNSQMNLWHIKREQKDKEKGANGGERH